MALWITGFVEVSSSFVLEELVLEMLLSLRMAGVFIGLWATGTEFNITSRMGMTMIVGIVTEIAIFYYSEFTFIAASDDRLIVAGINRMRAISMTAFAAILALLAARARGIGHGAAMQQPLAIAIISGTESFSLPLVLSSCPRCWPY